MCRKGTIRLLAVACCAAAASLPAAEVRLDWRRIGSVSLNLGLPSAASGPVLRVWYAPDGTRLWIRTASGKVFSTSDFQKWIGAADATPELTARSAPVTSTPEARVRLAAAESRAGRVYGLGRHVYRTDDGGVSWTNVTRFGDDSILGPGLVDVAVSPRDPDEVVVASLTGVWRSLDGGDTWAGVNDNLPNLPVRRVAGVATTGGIVRIQSRAGTDQEFEFAPGDGPSGWRPVDSPALRQERAALDNLTRTLAAPLVVLRTAGEYIYTGSSDGRIFSSSNAGQAWNPYALPVRGVVQALHADAQEPWIALAASSPVIPDAVGRVLRTYTAGGVWLDITGDLPAGAVHGVTADVATGAVYAATDAGVFVSYVDLRNNGAPASWTSLSGIPQEGRALDVKLDPAGNQLYVALEGYGVFAALAPHRMRDIRVVSAADLEARAAAPGALMSVLGAPVASVRTGTLPVPVLAATRDSSQIQIPFSVEGTSLPLSIETQGRMVNLGLPLKTVSPAIFAGPDGQPMIVNADTGSLLDPLAPVHSGGRLQIFATGLGKVRPDWPAGMPGPIDSPPEVIATVKAYLNREPLEVTRAILAPGYTGFYLVEVQLPRVVNAGQAELLIEAGGQQSNRAIIQLAP